MITGLCPVIPDYEIVSRLGVGGMGHVYLARHHGAYGFKKLLAVKVIHPDKSQHEDFRAMFRDEAKLLAQLDHPGIAQVYSFGESEDGLYLVMEYVAGMNLSELIGAPNAKLAPLACASIVAQVCRALHAAHELADIDGRPLGVVHRDVTPENIVLTFDGRVKILDFGIALMRQRSAPTTSHGFIRGKPSYLTPEQLRGDARVDRRTDIYALSIVLWELLTGQRLFRSDAVIDGAWRKAIEDVKPPSSLAGALPEGIDAIVAKGLAVEPVDRFQTAREMAGALEAVLERDGAESLEAFADRELARSRALHDERLRALLGGVESGARAEERPITLVDERAPAPEVPTEEAAIRAPALSPARPPARPGTGDDHFAEGASTVVRPPALPARRPVGRPLVAALVILGSLSLATYGALSWTAGVEAPTLPHSVLPAGDERAEISGARAGDALPEAAAETEVAEEARERAPVERPAAAPSGRRAKAAEAPARTRGRARAKTPEKNLSKRAPSNGLISEW